MKEVYDFLKKCNTYYLATVEGDQPRVRPFGTINLYNGKLYIQTGKVKDVSKQIGANPKVELCAFDGEKWLRIAATLVNDDSIEAKKDMLENYPNLKAMYDAEDDNTQVLWLKDAVATFSSFTAAPKTVKF
ncbi:MAG: pyridoxamine 5'-phosphate oxidase family protein [Firmicutes bacterium]|nr:pyridoxamine 5'-phosphate oxidase family protein [Bacillota bacterium]